jgi:hypothetical protein
MLAEIAAANAAFGIIKQAISNGKELASAGAAIAQFVGAKEDLQRKLTRRAQTRQTSRSSWPSNSFVRRRRS